MPDVHNRESGADAHRLAPAAPDEDHVYGACSPGWHSAADRGYAPERAIETVVETGRLPRDPVRAGNATEQELRDLLAVFR